MKKILLLTTLIACSCLGQGVLTVQYNTTNRLVTPTNLVLSAPGLTNATASRALIVDANKRITNSPVTATELSYSQGLTGNIQDQINAIAGGGGGGSGTNGVPEVILGPYTNNPVNLILDTDVGIDIDDAGDMSVMFGLAKQGEVKLLAVMTPITNWFSAPSIEVFNRYYGFSTVPIGQSKSVVTGPGSDIWGSNTATNYYNSVRDGSNVVNSTTLYRRILSLQPTNSVTIVFSGPLRNLLDLYNSSPDTNSILGGYALITNKVNRIIVAGGYWPTNAAPTNNNFTFDPTSAAILTNFNNVHTRVTYLGDELGNQVYTGGSITNKASTDPVRNAWLLQFAGYTDIRRQAWAQLALLTAARGYTNRGDVMFNRVVGIAGINGSTGANTFEVNPAYFQEYLTLNLSTNYYQTNLNNLLMLPAITEHDVIENTQTNISQLGFSGRDGATGYTNAVVFNTNAVIFDTTNYRYQFGRPFVVTGGQNDYNTQGRVSILGSPVSTTSLTNYDKMLQLVRPQGPGVSFGQAASLDLVRYAPQNGAFEGMGALQVNVGINQVSNGSDVTYNPAARFRSDAISEFFGPVYLTNGLVGYPALGFSSRTNSGFFVPSGTTEGEFDVTIMGTNSIRFYHSGIAFANDNGLAFLSGAFGSPITSLVRRYGTGLKVIDSGGNPSIFLVSTNYADNYFFAQGTNSGFRISSDRQPDAVVDGVSYVRMYEQGVVVATNGGYGFLAGTFAGGAPVAAVLKVDGSGVRTTKGDGNLSNHRVAEFQAGFPGGVQGSNTFYNAVNTNRFQLKAGTMSGDYVFTLPTDAPSVGEGLGVSAVSGANVTLDWRSFSGGSGAPVGTMVSSGTWSANQVPMTSDTTGTNYVASPITASGADINILGDIGAQDGQFTGTVQANGFNLNGTNLVAPVKRLNFTIINPTTGLQQWIYVPPADGFTINQATLAGDAAGSIVVDVWVDSYANYPPTVADTITASAKPTLSSANKSKDTTLTGWSKTIAGDSYVKINIDSASGLTNCVLTLSGY